MAWNPDAARRKAEREVKMYGSGGYGNRLEGTTSAVLESVRKQEGVAQVVVGTTTTPAQVDTSGVPAGKDLTPGMILRPAGAGMQEGGGAYNAAGVVGATGGVQGGRPVISGETGKTFNPQAIQGNTLAGQIIEASKKVAGAGISAGRSAGILPTRMGEVSLSEKITGRILDVFNSPVKVGQQVGLLPTRMGAQSTGLSYAEQLFGGNPNLEISGGARYGQFGLPQRLPATGGGARVGGGFAQSIADAGGRGLGRQYSEAAAQEAAIIDQKMINNEIDMNKALKSLMDLYEKYGDDALAYMTPGQLQMLDNRTVLEITEDMYGDPTGGGGGYGYGGGGYGGGGYGGGGAAGSSFSSGAGMAGLINWRL